MAINAGFLAVQGVGTEMVVESILKGSIVFCVGCLFSGMFAQHFSEKLKSLQFAVHFFFSCSNLMPNSPGLLPRPRNNSSCWGVHRTPFFYMMRQVDFCTLLLQSTYRMKSITWSSFGFLMSAVIDTQHSKFALITCACCLAVVTCILGPLAWYGLRAGVTPYVYLEDD